MPKHYMKVSFLIIILFFSLYGFGQNSIDGYYEGFLPKYDTLKNGKLVHRESDETKGYYWYSFIQLKIRNDSVFVDDSPVTIGKSDTIYSASDGGFYYFRGIFSIEDHYISIHLTEHFCDYCGVLKQKDNNGNLVIAKRKRSYLGLFSNGNIVFGDYKLERKNRSVTLKSEEKQPDWWRRD